MILEALTLTKHLHAPGHFYVLVGKELVLLDESFKHITQAFEKSIPAGKSFEKITLWIEDNQDWDKLSLETHYDTMFSTGLMINAKYQKNTLDAKALSFLNDYLKRPHPHCMLILQAPHINSKTLQPLFQQTTDAHLVNIPALKDGTLVQYIKMRLALENLPYHPTVPAFIAQLTQGNPLAALQCITQLSLLIQPGQTVEPDLVKQLLNDTSSMPLYAFSEACIRGNMEQVQKHLQQLQYHQTEPLIVLWWLAKTARQLLQLHHSQKYGGNFAQTCSKLSIWTSQIDLYQRACQRIPAVTLQCLLARCKQLDTLLKSAPPLHVWDAFDQIACSFCDPDFPLSPRVLQYA